MHEAEKQAREAPSHPPKEERLAEALRANLAKRKTAQRARMAREPGSDTAEASSGGAKCGPKLQEP